MDFCEQTMTDYITTIIAAATLVCAVFTLLAIVTDWFKRRIPLEYGFFRDDKIVTELKVSTGDPAKRILLRFHNSSKTTLVGVILDVRFLAPLVLSATQSAIVVPIDDKDPNPPKHGRLADERCYWIRCSEVSMLGDANWDLRVELNTQVITPGTYKVRITVYSTQQNYKYKQSELMITIT